MKADQFGDELGQVFAKTGQRVCAASTNRDRGAGPFRRMVLRGAMIVDGSGAPPWGPADLVIENDKIVDIQSVGMAKVKIDPTQRPSKGDHEIDCHGKFVTPGFVDGHVHIGAPAHSLIGEPPPADYIYKLWLAHGITTVREMGCFNGLGWTLEQKAAAEANKIAAPRIMAYPYFPAVQDRVKTIHTPQQAREWVRGVKQRGADGVKFFGSPPAIMEAALDECAKVGLGSGCHHSAMAVHRMNCLTTARWGLQSTEHFYGIPEALFESRTIQDFPTDYNFKDEFIRMRTLGATFAEGARPGTAKWDEVVSELVRLKHVFVPTMAIYDTNRDIMRSRNADWHPNYTLKVIWDYFQPKRTHMGSYFYKWTTAVEVEWKTQLEIWMHFLADFKNRGGRVCVGSDAGFMFQTFGFGYVRELELLREAGFSALEVLRAATLHGAELLGIDNDYGMIDVGKKADLLIHRTNPLEDFKPLYGSGALRLNEELERAEFVRGLESTIKNGVVYDVGELLSDIRDMVDKSYGRNKPADSDTIAQLA